MNDRCPSGLRGRAREMGWVLDETLMEGPVVGGVGGVGGGGGVGDVWMVVRGPRGVGQWEVQGFA